MMSGLRSSATCITFFCYMNDLNVNVYNIQMFQDQQRLWQRKYARPTNPTGPACKRLLFCSGLIRIKKKKTSTIKKLLFVVVQTRL